jgi:ribosomal protein L37AE/L43A
MPYRACPNCNQSSYISNDRGIWVCPYCGKDITLINKALKTEPSKDKNKKSKFDYPPFFKR